MNKARSERQRPGRAAGRTMSLERPPQRRQGEARKRMRHRNVLEYANFRYLKLAALIGVGSLVAYLWARTPAEAPQFPFGSTWTGYALGTLGALIILWLLWFGIRKRRYRGVGTVQGWLSAHVYIGTVLLLVATLHTGFSFGWNVHTLAYGLMVAVILSGFYGVYVYLRVPAMISANMADDSLGAILADIGDADREAAKVALQLPNDVISAVQVSARETRIGGSLWRQLSSGPRRDPTDLALALLERNSKRYKGDEANRARELYGLLVHKRALVQRARREIRLKAILQMWLVVHVPLSIALLSALTAHIVSVFFYW